MNCYNAPKTIGDRIREKREEKKMTQEELTNQLGLTNRRLVSFWETDRRTISIDILPKLATLLDTTCDYILTGYEAKNTFLSREYEGLTDKALENIRKLFPTPPPAPYIDYEYIQNLSRAEAASLLFENLEVFDLIYRFLEFDVNKFEDGLGHCKIGILSETQEPIDTVYGLEDLSHALYSRIYQALVALRKKLYDIDDSNKKSKEEKKDAK